jgi:hypothetical protein
MRHQAIQLAAALFSAAIALGTPAGAARAEAPRPGVPPAAPVTAQPAGGAATQPVVTPAKAVTARPPTVKKATTAAIATTPASAPKPAPLKTVTFKPAPLKTVTLKPAPPATDDPYRCHPSADIACTVVRETADGLVIATLRGPGVREDAPNWSVVSGAPPAPATTARGTVYVVPTATFTPAYHDGPLPMPLANGAPILD